MGANSSALIVMSRTVMGQSANVQTAEESPREMGQFGGADSAEHGRQ